MPKTTYTLTLPDGSVATRTVQKAVYTFAVVAKDDRRKEAAEHIARAEAIETYHAAVTAVIASGDLSVLGRRRSSYSVAEGWSYASHHPMASESPLWRADAARAIGRRYQPTAAHMAPWLPDHQDTEEWARYAGSSLARMLATAQDHRRKAAALNEGPEFDYHVARWSSTYPLAVAASQSAELGARLPYRTMTVVPVTQ